MGRKSKMDINGDKKDELKKRILEILKINEDNKYFSLFEIDCDQELQNKIYELEDFCLKYFAVKGWTHFRNKEKGKINNRMYLTFIRNIFDFCEIKYINKQTSMVINNHVIYYMKYTII